MFNRDSSKYPLLALTVPYELLVAKAGFLAFATSSSGWYLHAGRLFVVLINAFAFSHGIPRWNSSGLSFPVTLNVRTQFC